MLTSVLLFPFSDVKVQVEAEDMAMMLQLKPEDFVCFSTSLYSRDHM